MLVARILSAIIVNRSDRAIWMRTVAATCTMLSAHLMHEIDRNDIQLTLVRAAQIRVGVTFAALLAGLTGLGILPVGVRDSWAAPTVVFGLPMLASWLATELVCKPMVKCGVCGGSLWGIGTGNFKPRRMGIKEGVVECPRCHALIIGEEGTSVCRFTSGVNANKERGDDAGRNQ